MSSATKLVLDLGVTLRGIRSHEGLVEARAAQAANPAVARRLRATAARERVVADRVERVLRRRGAAVTRTRPARLPSPTSVLAAVASRTQPLGETLVLEATTVRMLADRARVVHGVAVTLNDSPVADVASQVVDLYDEYAGWLVDTASALVVDGDSAELVPTTGQRLAGRVKDVAAAPVRVFDRVTDRAVTLVGLGHDKLDDAVDSTVETVKDTTDSAVETVKDAADSVRDSVDDALTPVQASDLAVSRYDSRTASDAAAAVRGLDDIDAVSTVMAYEAQHKDRKTVLDAADKRVAELADASR